MSAQKAQQSPKPGSGNPWLMCSKCPCMVTQKDVETHRNDCPPNEEKLSHSFIKDRKLYGCVDLKVNEDVKGATPQERNSMVFLSQSVIQLCELGIGEWAVVRPLESGGVPFTCLVWPTVEKSSTCVLFTKYCLENLKLKEEQVVVSKIPANVFEAAKVCAVLLNGPKLLEITAELISRIHKSHFGRVLCTGNKLSVMYYGKLLSIEIKSIETSDKKPFDVLASLEQLSLNNSHEFFCVTDKTTWNVYKNLNVYTNTTTKSRTILNIGGLDAQIKEIQNSMQIALERSSENHQICRSVLMYGSSGTGKSMLTRALIEETKVKVVSINLVDIYSKYTGNADETIKSLFQEAIESAPTLIIIDEIELLCPVRTGRLTDVEKRVVSVMLTMLDTINNLNSKIFIIASTNKPEAIDPAFRRCDRLDREIEIPVPNSVGRLDILQKLFKDCNGEVLKEIAGRTHGFVGADLKSLCSCARLQSEVNGTGEIGLDEFEVALTKVSPSAMREVQIDIPNVKWSDVGGQNNLKLILRQAVEWPLKHAESFQRLGITPPRGVLMFGPPGCSKTMIAKALATESGLNFLSIKGPELFSKWVGESERAVRELFRKARQVAPSVIFFDEIDALGGERTSGSSASVQERVLAQLLTELDGVSALGNVTILAATNRPDKIDKALLRPGRLDRIVYVPLPDAKTREDIFKIKLAKMPVQEVNVEELVLATVGYSGAEINAVCHEAAMKALEESLDIEFVGAKHFEEALKIVRPRISKSLLKLYDDYLSSDKENNVNDS